MGDCRGQAHTALIFYCARSLIAREFSFAWTGLTGLGLRRELFKKLMHFYFSCFLEIFIAREVLREKSYCARSLIAAHSSWFIERTTTGGYVLKPGSRIGAEPALGRFCRSGNLQIWQFADLAISRFGTIGSFIMVH